MTDAKQALEVAEDLRIGLAEMAASCSVNMETWDRFSNNVLDAASLLSSLAEENERLRGALGPFLTLARAVTVDGSPDFVHWAREAKDWVVAFSFAGHSVSIGDLRALAALTTHPAQPEGEGHEC